MDLTPDPTSMMPAEEWEAKKVRMEATIRRFESEGRRYYFVGRPVTYRYKVIGFADGVVTKVQQG